MFEELKQFFFKGSVLARLIGINLVVFVGVNLIRLVFFLWNLPGVGDILTSWLGIPANLGTLLTRPWTLISYMFLHFDFFHILFNMFVLYVGGRLFTDFIGASRLTTTYVIGGLSGALFFMLAYNFFPVFTDVRADAVALGASASVLAIFVTIAVYRPNYKLPLILIGPVKLKYIALIFVIIDLLSIERGNPGGHIAHLGGALWGYIYASMLKTGNDPAGFINKWLSQMGNIFRPKPRMKVRYTQARPMNDVEYNKQRAEQQKEIDRILDKISQSGYDSLNSKEKELLFKMGGK